MVLLRQDNSGAGIIKFKYKAVVDRVYMHYHRVLVSSAVYGLSSLIIECEYRIVSNLTDNSNYPDTISNYFFTSNYTGQSMKFEFLF